MEKPTRGFTVRYLDSLRPKDRDYEIREPNGNGFGIRVYPSGVKTFCFFYKIDGKKRREVLGNYPALSLADAHELFNSIYKRYKNNEWPLRPEPAPPAPPQCTFRDMWKAYLRNKVQERMRHCKSQSLPFSLTSHLREQIRIMKKDVLDYLGDAAPADINRTDIHDLLERIKNRGARCGAYATFRVIRPVFKYGVGTGKYGIENSPCFMMEVSGKPGKRRRNLGPAEIKDFWDELDRSRMAWGTVTALKMMLLTGQRPYQVAEMPLSEIDGEWWDIPPHRTKIELPQRVFLVPMALELLELGEERTWTFPAASDPDKCITRGTMRQATARMCAGKDRPYGKKRWEHPPFSPHDLRRTVSTQMQALGIDDRVIDALHHHVPMGVRANYNQHRFDEEKRQALLLWETRLKEILATGK